MCRLKFGAPFDVFGRNSAGVGRCKKMRMRDVSTCVALFMAVINWCLWDAKKKMLHVRMAPEFQVEGFKCYMVRVFFSCWKCY